MISIHIKTGGPTGKWYTRIYKTPEHVSESFIVDIDALITNLKNTRGWEVKIGYNLLRAIHANI